MEDEALRAGLYLLTGPSSGYYHDEFFGRQILVEGFGEDLDALLLFLINCSSVRISVPRPCHDPWPPWIWTTNLVISTGMNLGAHGHES